MNLVGGYLYDVNTDSWVEEQGSADDAEDEPRMGSLSSWEGLGRNRPWTVRMVTSYRVYGLGMCLSGLGMADPELSFSLF